MSNIGNQDCPQAYVVPTIDRGLNPLVADVVEGL